MIYNFFARVIAKTIGIFDPLRAARYLSQQDFFQRGYLAAKTNGPDRKWRVGKTSGAQENVAAWEKVTNKARDLARNNPYIVGARRRHRGNIISEGIWPRPKILLPGAKSKFELATDLNTEILRRWEEWAPTAGANGDTLYSIQRTAANHFFDDGQFLLRRIYKKNPSELKIQLLECDHLDISRDQLATMDQNKVVGGIELDQYNKPIAYWLLPEHPAENTSLSVRIPAEEIIHVFDRQRASDVTGICGYASVVQSVFRINEFAYSTMDTARLTNHFGIWIESPYVDDFNQIQSTSAPTAETGEGRHEFINPAGFHYGLPGEKPHMMNPAIPGSQYGPFMTKELQTTSVGAGVGYESVSHDGSQTNFAGSRALLIIERGYTRMNQAIFEEQMHSKVYQWFIEFEMSLARRPLQMPNYASDRMRYLRVKFNRPVQEWVDPQKDINARGERIRLRLSTETDEAEENGKDIEEIYATLAYEKALREKLGIVSEEEKPPEQAQEEEQLTPEQEEIIGENINKWLK